MDPRITTPVVERLTQASVDKIDLLLAIDNSRSMADKQAILAQAVPDLVEALVSPPCVDLETGAPLPERPEGPLAACPPGFEREIEPILDIHIGIISSSLGGHGSDACRPGASLSNDDRAHLLARSAPEMADDLQSSTYEGKLFLAWDPAQRIVDPPWEPDPGDGEADLDADSAGDLNGTALIPLLSQMVRGVGQVGCGYEAQLESWYRFLVDPEPHASIEVINGEAVPQGLDETLLKQRADFLRPGSLLAILVLSDENDCSMREGGQYFLAAQQANEDGSIYHLPRARTECATNPASDCCLSCVQDQGSCPPDPSCYVNGDPAQGVAPLDFLEDPTNLRCFDQKRRFGIDFLYPIDRYTSALMSPQIQNRAGELVENPLFMDLNPNDQHTGVRDPGLVFFAAIVGVPWQDIARDPTDLIQGFKGPDELFHPVGDAGSTWEIILGDPANHVAPMDPFMVESIEPRAGKNPITGDEIRPPGSAEPNPINGTEWTIAAQNDLQYACIFDLPQGAERDCSIPGAHACDCDQGNDNPLCAPNPNDGGERTLQVKAKAYPGLRELAVARGMGSQGVVGSVCPAQLSDETRADFGYRPAIGAIVDRLKPTVSRQCFPHKLTPDAEGRVSCAIIEAREAGGACDCSAPAGRRPVSPDLEGLVAKIQEDPLAGPSGWNCYCEVTQATGEELEACQSDPSEPIQTESGAAVHGFCYIDAEAGVVSQEVLDEVLAACPATERRLIRFAGQGEPQAGATLFIACSVGG